MPGDGQALLEMEDHLDAALDLVDVDAAADDVSSAVADHEVDDVAHERAPLRDGKARHGDRPRGSQTPDHEVAALVEVGPPPRLARTLSRRGREPRYFFLNRMLAVGIGEIRPDGPVHVIEELL